MKRKQADLLKWYGCTECVNISELTVETVIVCVCMYVGVAGHS